MSLTYKFGFSRRLMPASAALMLFGGCQTSVPPAAPVSALTAQRVAEELGEKRETAAGAAAPATSKPDQSQTRATTGAHAREAAKPVVGENGAEIPEVLLTAAQKAEC